MKAYAKINIYLHVLNKRDDGYHNLDSLMVPINLYDELFFEESNDIELISNINIENNIIIKCANYLKETYKVNKGVKIILKKNIPIAAGLGGGSADLAATLKGLNEFWNLGLSIDELAKISLLFGSDTLFCIYNKKAIIKGRGDIIDFIDFENKKILLVNPKIEVKTKDVFMEYKSTDAGVNDLEMALLRLNPSIKEMKEYYKSKGIDLLLSGSGPTYFAYVENYEIDKNSKYLEIITETI